MEWKALSSQRADSTHTALEKELDLVKTWRVNGERLGEEPETPVFDRLLAICKESRIEYKNLRTALRISTERNELVHHPPPLVENHLKPDKTVDWASVERACKSCKDEVREAFHNGYFTEANMKEYVALIDQWFDTFQTSDGKGGKEETDHAKSVISQSEKDQRAEAKAQTFPIPASPYHAGKWAEIPK